MWQSIWNTLLPGVVMFCLTLIANGSDADELVEVIRVELTWSGHPVGFSLLTSPPHQYVAYYDAQRQMTIAQRSLDSSTWTFTRLPSKIGWDSHNYVTMAIDRNGYLHVAGNMHCVPLIYFRSRKAYDSRTLSRVPNMVSPNRERRVTYPVFFHGPDKELVFRYRDGSSGNGDDIYNVYDEFTSKWTRLTETPLTSGRGKMNAYCSRPTLGPDGRYHIVWVWRDTPDCATNHDLSYARSRDLVHWETAGGKPLALPITLEAGAVIDPVPPRGGLINGGNRLGFDSTNRPLIVYHKYDADGYTQIYIARFVDRQWKTRRISNWAPYRWEFSGGGSIPFEVRIGRITCVDRQLRIECSYGRGKASWVLDESTLEPIPGNAQTPAATHRDKLSAPRGNPTRKMASQRKSRLSPTPPLSGMRVRSARDLGSSDDGTDYRLRWFSLGPNRDRPRPGPLPPPSMLEVLRFSK